MIYTDDKYIRDTIFKRKEDSHKGDFGKMLIFNGSTGMAGAAVLSGRAALKTGAGLVRFLIPSFESPLYQILQICVPEATCVEVFGKQRLHPSGCDAEAIGKQNLHPSNHDSDETFATSKISESIDISINLSEYDSIVAGCGLGKSTENKQILTYIIENYSGVLVLDADALNLISEDPELQEKTRNSKASKIITPHVGEAKRLLNTCEGIKGMEIRKKVVETLAEKYRAIALLKGSGTLTSDSNTIYENLTGNPGMATGGSGDVLSGIIGSLAAQGYKPLDAARMGAFLHGKAGDLAAEQLTEMGMTASDIVDFLPAALKQYYKFTCTITY